MASVVGFLRPDCVWRWRLNALINESADEHPFWRSCAERFGGVGVRTVSGVFTVVVLWMLLPVVTSNHFVIERMPGASNP